MRNVSILFNEYTRTKMCVICAQRERHIYTSACLISATYTHTQTAISVRKNSMTKKEPRGPLKINLLKEMEWTKEKLEEKSLVFVERYSGCLWMLSAAIDYRL